jgi:hypothetical protein
MVHRHDGLAKPAMAYNYAPTLLSKLVMQLFLERPGGIGDDNLHGCEAPLVGKIIDTRGRGKISEGGVRHIPKT